MSLSNSRLVLYKTLLSMYLYFKKSRPLGASVGKEEIANVDGVIRGRGRTKFTWLLVRNNKKEFKPASTLY